MRTRNRLLADVQTNPQGAGVLNDSDVRAAFGTLLRDIAKAIRDFGAGLVVPPDDAAALAAAIGGLLADGAALQRAFAGAEAARGALTWDAAAARHEALYEEIRR